MSSEADLYKLSVFLLALQSTTKQSQFQLGGTMAQSQEKACITGRSKTISLAAACLYCCTLEKPSFIQHF